MDKVTAAMVLTSLSTSPLVRSPPVRPNGKPRLWGIGKGPLTPRSQPVFEESHSYQTQWTVNLHPLTGSKGKCKRNGDLRAISFLLIFPGSTLHHIRTSVHSIYVYWAPTPSQNTSLLYLCFFCSRYIKIGIMKLCSPMLCLFDWSSSWIKELWRLNILSQAP